MTSREASYRTTLDINSPHANRTMDYIDNNHFNRVNTPNNTSNNTISIF